MKAVELDSILFEAINSIGLTYKKLGKFEDTLEWYGRAAEAVVFGFQDQLRDRMLQEQVINGERTLVMLPGALELLLEQLEAWN